MGRLLILLGMLAAAHDVNDLAANPLAPFGAHANVIDHRGIIGLRDDGALVLERGNDRVVVGGSSHVGIVLELGPSGPLRIVEQGVQGEAQRVRGAIAIDRATGRSYWTGAHDRGLEEWIDVAAGSAADGRAIASWSIVGASFRAVPGASGVHVVRADGAVVAYVEATEAWTESGNEAHPRLQLETGRLVLYVEPTQERVLVDPTWVGTGSMALARVATEAPVEAAHLSTGILVAGGWTGGSGFPIATAERYDVTTGVWSSAASMSLARAECTLTQLADGRVLVAGGNHPSATRTAEIYDPGLDRWTSAAPMSVGRGLHTATRLADGRVLVVGGVTTFGACLSSTEIYDPVADTWTTTASVPGGRCWHSAVLLLDGRVLVAGGGDGSGAGIGTAAVYSPTTNTWSPAGSLPSARSRMSATRLADGRVLVAGGGDLTGALSSTTIYNPTTNLWTATGNLGNARQDQSAMLLGDGRVLVVGGLPAAALATSEYYTPATGVWTAGPALVTGRYDPYYALLPSGRVIVAGGATGSGGTATASSEILVEDACGNGTIDAGETCDDGNHRNGDCCSGLCTIERAGTVCRAAPGACDLADTCDGSSPACPADTFVAASTACRPSVGECDVAESCTGVTAACPPDGAQVAGTACGPTPSGPCDAQNTCTGTVGASARCMEVVASAATLCRVASCAVGLETDAALCDGTRPNCPASTMRVCAPYVCGSTACMATCTTSADCTGGLSCIGTACVNTPDAATSTDAALVSDAGGGFDAATMDAAPSLDAAMPIDAAVAADAMPTSDAGPRPDSGYDAGFADGSTRPDASGLAPASPGCGCTVGRTDGSIRLLALALVGVAIGRRRRIRARRDGR